MRMPSDRAATRFAFYHQSPGASMTRDEEFERRMGLWAALQPLKHDVALNAFGPCGFMEVRWGSGSAKKQRAWSTLPGSVSPSVFFTPAGITQTTSLTRERSTITPTQGGLLAG